MRKTNRDKGYYVTNQTDSRESNMELGRNVEYFQGNMYGQVVFVRYKGVLASDTLIKFYYYFFYY